MEGKQYKFINFKLFWGVKFDFNKNDNQSIDYDIIIPIKILPGYNDSKCNVLQVSESWSWNTASSIRDLKILVAVIVENQIKLLKRKQKKCFNKSCSSWLTDCLTE